MSEQPSPTSWQTTIQRQVENNLPRDFTLLTCHQSRGSESLYFTLLKDGTVFDLRLSYHPNAHPANDLIEFNLRSFEGKRALTSALNKALLVPGAGYRLTYHDFVALALVEKLSQSDGIYLVGQEHLLCATATPLPPLLETTLLAQRAHKWLLTRFRDGQLLLSHTGAALLEAYWDVADTFIDENIWDDNPRIESPAEMIAHFA